DPRLLALALFGLPALAHGVWAQRRRHRVQEGLAERARLQGHLLRLAAEPMAGRELRVFGLRDEIVRRFRTSRDEDDRVEDRERIASALVGTAAWAFFGLGFAGATFLVAGRVVEGRSPLGDLVLTLTLTTQLGATIGALVLFSTWLTESLRNAARYLWLRDYAARATRS